MKRKTSARRIKTAASLAAFAGLWCAEAHAGSHKTQLVPVAPVYLQQAPAVQTYSAPAVSVYSAPAAPVYSAPAPAVQVYSAPTVQTYSAPTVQTYSAPTVQVYSAPTAPVYSAPVSYYTTGVAGGTINVGNAPLAGAKISAVDREDIVAELRKEAKEETTSGSMRERRKALRESARAMYAEALEVEESELGEADLQDLEIVVNSILSRGSTTSIRTAIVQSAPASPAPVASFAPSVVPMQATTLVQPMVPVQLLVPIQPKHHWLHK